MSITLHQSGLDAAVNAEANGLSGLTLATVELWNQTTKIKTLALQGVDVIEPSRIYVVATDSDAEVYEVYALHFYTDTGILYATAQHDDNRLIQAKASDSAFVLAVSLDLSAAPSTIVASGDLSLYAPPADEDKFGTVIYAKEDDFEQTTQQRKVLSPSWLWKWWDRVRYWDQIQDKPIGEGADQLPSMASFSHQLSDYTGEYRLPGGIYIVIGFVEMTCSTDSTITAYTGTSTFPVAFSEIVNVALGGVFQYGQADELAYGVQTLSNTAIAFRMRRIYGSQQETVKICYQVWGRRDF